jgi:uncharacterized protein YraI
MALSLNRPLIAAGMLLVGLSVPAAATAGNSYTTATLNLRAGPGAGYAALTAVPAGAAVHLRKCGDGWCQVSWRGLRGWVAEGFLLRGGVKPSPSVGASAHAIYQIMDMR